LVQRAELCLRLKVASLTLLLLLQTVTVADAVASARPLAAQPVRKGKVWLLLAGGAAALFGGTILLENNEQFFPAIARANKAIARSREQQQAWCTGSTWLPDSLTLRAQCLMLVVCWLQKEQQRRQAVVAERDENARLLSALEDGLQSATDRQVAASARNEEATGTATSGQASSSKGNHALVTPRGRPEADMGHVQSAESNAKVRGAALLAVKAAFGFDPSAQKMLARQADNAG